MVSRSSRLVTVGLAAAIALGAGAGTAAASRQLGNNGGRTITSEITPLTITEAGGVSIRCESIVEGVMNQVADIEKVLGAAAGNIDQLETRNCRSSTGLAAIVEFLVAPGSPRHMTYVSFSGTLPRITEVLFRWEIGFLIHLETWGGCLYEGRAAVGTGGTLMGETYQIEKYLFLENRISLVQQLRRGLMECPTSMSLRASFIGRNIAVKVILLR